MQDDIFNAETLSDGKLSGIPLIIIPVNGAQTLDTYFIACNYITNLIRTLEDYLPKRAEAVTEFDDKFFKIELELFDTPSTITVKVEPLSQKQYETEKARIETMGNCHAFQIN